MRVKKPYPYEEFDVFCSNCKHTIVVEGPEDLSKYEQDGEEIFCLICPVCDNVIKFDGIMGHTLNKKFRESVRTRDSFDVTLDKLAEDCRKLNEDFDGIFDKR